MWNNFVFVCYKYWNGFEVTFGPTFLIKMASDGHAKIYFVLGKLKLSLSCMKSVSSKYIDWACSSNQCFDALIEIKELSSQFQANNSLYILFNCNYLSSLKMIDLGQLSDNLESGPFYLEIIRTCIKT